MREGLWPSPPGEHEREVDDFLASKPTESAVLVAQRVESGLAGFVEIGIRSYAEGTDSRRVAYVEGWWVDPDVRRAGVGRALIEATEGWAQSRAWPNWRAIVS